MIPADAWERGTPLAIEPVATAFGTEIRIALPDAWGRHLVGDVQAAALHYPLPVFHDGAPCDRGDFLRDAVAIEEACGCRIGVYRGEAPCDRRLNFHGLQVRCGLPQVGEVDRPLLWSVRIDIVDAPDLKLVLPARKDVVENAAITDLRVAVERAIYRAIGTMPSHRLSFTAWTRARALGVALLPAEASLAAWVPAVADGDGRPFPTMVAGEPMLIVPELEPDLAQAAAPALRKPAFIAARPVTEQDAFTGYAWYDALPRVDTVAIHIHLDGAIHHHGDGDEAPAGLVSRPVDDLQLAFTLRDGTCESVPPAHRYPIEALVCDSGSYDLDDALVLLRRGTEFTADRLAAQIESVLFCADED